MHFCNVHASPEGVFICFRIFWLFCLPSQTVAQIATIGEAHFSTWVPKHPKGHPRAHSEFNREPRSLSYSGYRRNVSAEGRTFSMKDKVEHTMWRSKKDGRSVNFFGIASDGESCCRSTNLMCSAVLWLFLIWLSLVSFGRLVVLRCVSEVFCVIDEESICGSGNSQQSMCSLSSHSTDCARQRHCARPNRLLRTLESEDTRYVTSVCHFLWPYWSQRFMGKLRVWVLHPWRQPFQEGNQSARVQGGRLVLVFLRLCFLDCTVLAIGYVETCFFFGIAVWRREAQNTNKFILEEED